MSARDAASWVPGRVRCTTIVASALTLLLFTGGAAHAAGPDGWTPGIEIESQGVLTTAIDVRDMVPGMTRDAILFIANPAPDPINSMAIHVVNLRDLENGCNASEIAAGDATCGDGPDQGELSRWLLTTFQAGTEVTSGTGRACTVDEADGEVQGSLFDLAQDSEPASIPPPRGIEDGEPWCIVASFHHEFRDATDNLTQGDTVEFDLEVTASALPATEVGGEVVERSPSGTGDPTVSRTVSASQVRPAGTAQTVGLVDTGERILELIAFGLLLLVVGALMRRHPRAAARSEVRR